MTTQVDPGLQSVLDNIQVIAASEGGSIQFVESRGGKLTIEYTPGVNEECPECVPTHDLIEMMVKSSTSRVPFASKGRAAKGLMPCDVRKLSRMTPVVQAPTVIFHETATPAALKPIVTGPAAGAS